MGRLDPDDDPKLERGTVFATHTFNPPVNVTEADRLSVTFSLSMIGDGEVHTSNYRVGPKAGELWMHIGAGGSRYKFFAMGWNREQEKLFFFVGLGCDNLVITKDEFFADYERWTR
jgi:hypothetical protein